MRQRSQSWLKQAKADLETARVDMEAKRHYASVFFSQQAVEKSLKAAYISLKHKNPPRTHDLDRLAEMISKDQDFQRSVRILEEEESKTRYPDAAGGIPADQFTEEDAKRYLSKASDIVSKVEGWVSDDR
ncbi:MAG: HEPN domain-containing protein [Bacillota bacterium]